jgi:curved DNA-binding protein CbpA
VKPLAEQSHYDVLEVPRGASADDIERAWVLAVATWDEDSLAVYPLFGSDDAACVRERLELAYRVLSDPEARSRYDATLEDPTPPADPAWRALEAATQPSAPAAELDPELLGLDDPEDEADRGSFGGARLRRARLRRGLELEQIANTTKVNPTYLRFLEEEYFPGLPAPVYVRGFVVAYARCVGLDPQPVAASYMQRFFVASRGTSRAKPER